MAKPKNYLRESNRKGKHPYLSQYLSRFFSKKMIGQNIVYFDQSDSIISSYLKAIEQKYFEVFLTHITEYELTLFKSKQLVNEKTSVEDFFLESYQDEEYVDYIYEKYPYLIDKAESFFLNQIKYLNEIIDFLYLHRNEIISFFRLDILKLSRISPFRGDIHFNNRSTVFLEIEGSILVFKNRNANLDIEVHRLLNKIGVSSYTPKIYQSNFSSLVEFIAPDTFTNHKQIEEYYFKFGKLIYVSYLLSSEDIISENLITKNYSPVIIDCECFITPSRLLQITDDVVGTISNSVLKAGILPSDYNLGRFFPMSPLVYSAGKQTSRSNSGVVEMETYPEVRDDLIFNYLPLYNGKNVAVHSFLKNLLIGFSDAANDKNLVHDCRSFIRKVTFSRFIARDTEMYDKILRESNRPIYLKSKRNSIRFISEIIPKHPGYEKFHKEEVMQLLNSDIPIFYSNVNDHALYNADKKIVQGKFFNQNPTALFAYKKKATKKSEEIKKQNTIIKNSIFHSDSIDRNLSLFKLKRTKPIIQNHEKVEYNINSHVNDSFLVINKRVYFLGITHEGIAPKFYFNIIDTDFYAGSSGIIFAILTQSHPKNIELKKMMAKELGCLVDDIKKTLSNLGTAKDARIKFYSAFHFPSFILHFIFAGLLREKESSQILKLYEKWLIINIDNDTLSDYLLGSSSLIALIFKNSSFFSEEFLHKIYIKYLNLLQKKIRISGSTATFNFSDRFNENHSVGLCHGNIGVAIALSSILKKFKDYEVNSMYEKIIKYIQVCYDFNSKILFSNIEKTNKTLPSYNHGAGGLMVLLLCSDIFEEVERKIIINQFIQITIDGYKQFNNYTIANGSLGNFIIASSLMNKYSQIISNDLKQAFANTIKTMDLDSLFRYSHSPKLFLNPDLYTGISGILYFLNYYRNSSCYNILTFEKN